MGGRFEYLERGYSDTGSLNSTHRPQAREMNSQHSCCVPQYLPLPSFCFTCTKLKFTIILIRTVRDVHVMLSTHLSLSWGVVFFVQHRHFLSLSDDCCLGLNSLLLKTWLTFWSGTSSRSLIRGVGMLLGDGRAAHEWKALFSLMFAFLCHILSLSQCFVAIAQNVTTNPHPIVVTLLLLLSLFYNYFTNLGTAVIPCLSLA